MKRGELGVVRDARRVAVTTLVLGSQTNLPVGNAAASDTPPDQNPALGTSISVAIVTKYLIVLNGAPGRMARCVEGATSQPTAMTRNVH